MVLKFSLFLQAENRSFLSSTNTKCFPVFVDCCPITRKADIWSEWRLTVIAATVRIALVDILDLSEVDIPAGVFLHPALGWG